LRERLLGHFAEAKQIHISSGTDGLAEPDEHQQRAFEHEALGMPRVGETIEEAFHGESREHEIRIHPDGLGVADEAHLNRYGETCGRGGHATSASR